MNSASPLHRSPRVDPPTMLHIRPMTAHDVALGMRLSGQAGWNQTEADWRRFLQIQPDGAFVAEWDGRPVGTVADFVFGPVGWIAMLLVDRDFRGRGIGTRLMQQAMNYLASRGVATMRLDATALGRPIYEKLGFVAEYELARMEGTANAGPACARIHMGAADRIDAVLELDRLATGTDRRPLLRRLHRQRPEAVRVALGADEPAGYLMWRPGSNATQIGPGAALTEQAAEGLGDAALARHPGRPVFVDVPLDNRAAVRWAESHGLTVQRCFTRMRKGEPVVDDPARLLASSGPEKG